MLVAVAHQYNRSIQQESTLVRSLYLNSLSPRPESQENGDEDSDVLALGAMYIYNKAGRLLDGYIIALYDLNSNYKKSSSPTMLQT
jgi:hypothetical protein